MKPVFKLLISLAAGVLAMVLIGVYAFSLASSYQAKRAEALKSFASKDGGSIVSVVVARTDLSAGDRITSDEVVVRDWVSDLLPAGAFQKASDVAGKEVKGLILAGEPITAARLGNSGMLSLDVPNGFEAVSIPSGDVLAVGGAVRRGSRIDIYATANGDAFMLADNVLVLATSNDVAGADSGSSAAQPSLTWVTIALQPDIIGRVLKSVDGNTLHLVLRKGGVSASPSTSGTAN